MALTEAQRRAQKRYREKCQNDPAWVERRRRIEAERYAVRKSDPAYIVAREESSKRSRNAQKALAVEAYGGGKCLCCGETELSMLTLDHIHNDGAEERRKTKAAIGVTSGYKFYRMLRRQGWPPGFQVLCFNCNISKHINKGVCAHSLVRVV